MTQVMAESGHPQDAPPISQLVLVANRVQTPRNLGSNVARIRHDIKNTAREFHYPERVLESTVCRSGIDKVRQSELMDMPKPLEGRGIQDLTLSGIQTHKDMDRIPDLVYVFRHDAANNEGCASSTAARSA